MSRPIIVQHCAGQPGSGGPATAMERLVSSSISNKYEFVVMRQEHAAGGVDFGLICRWVRLLRSVRPDIVHVRGLGNEGFHGVMAAKLANCPRVLLSVHGTVRDIFAPRSLRRSGVVNVAERASLLMATHVATVCAWGASRSFLDGVHSKMVGTVPNGVSVDAAHDFDRTKVRHELGIGLDDVALVSVGRLSSQKGHYVLAEALRLLPERVRGIVLVVVGSGPDETEIQRGYEGVPGLRTQMLGHRADVDRILNACDIFVFPTLHENLSNALLEAMADGLAVVATAVGGNTEVLRSGGGELVPAGDVRALGSAIDAMVADPDRRIAMGAVARRVVAERYSLDRMTEGWATVYQRILDETS